MQAVSHQNPQSRKDPKPTILMQRSSPPSPPIPSNALALVLLLLLLTPRLRRHPQPLHPLRNLKVFRIRRIGNIDKHASIMPAPLEQRVAGIAHARRLAMRAFRQLVIDIGRGDGGRRRSTALAGAAAGAVGAAAAVAPRRPRVRALGRRRGRHRRAVELDGRGVDGARGRVDGGLARGVGAVAREERRRRLAGCAGVGVWLRGHGCEEREAAGWRGWSCGEVVTVVRGCGSKRAARAGQSFTVLLRRPECNLLG